MLKAKNALLILVVYVLHLWLAKRAVIKRLVKILFFEKAYRLVMYTSAS
jgi:hypothetical protein